MLAKFVGGPRHGQKMAIPDAHWEIDVAGLSECHASVYAPSSCIETKIFRYLQTQFRDKSGCLVYLCENLKPEKSRTIRKLFHEYMLKGQARRNPFA